MSGNFLKFRGVIGIQPTELASVTSVRVGFVGLGLIGKQRLSALRRLQEEIPNLELVGCVDPYQENLPSQFKNLNHLLEVEPELLFVAVPHVEIYGICEQVLEHNVRVHVEKPLGTNSVEARKLEKLDREGKALTVGFNYRFFRGVESILNDVKSGLFGEVIRMDFVLGHGGSPADGTSWKLDPFAAGGGSLLDPGVHLLDLLLQVTTNPKVTFQNSWKGFWKTGIDEECTAALTSPEIPLITINSSIVRWRSEFMVRVIGSDGYGVVTGRGRSYGPQRYVVGKRWGWQNHASQLESEVVVIEDECEDSFEREMKQLISPNKMLPNVATSKDGVLVMELLEDIQRHVS